MHLSTMFSLKWFSATLAQVINELKLDPVYNDYRYLSNFHEKTIATMIDSKYGNPPLYSDKGYDI